MNYYATQLERINKNTEFSLSIVITDSEGNKTNSLNINEESVKEFISFFSSFLARKVEFTRINNDVNGNPRYVCHYTSLLSINDANLVDYDCRKNASYKVDEEYKVALKKAKQLGGKKYNNKSYGGGIIFQSYNIQELEIKIINLNK